MVEEIKISNYSSIMPPRCQISNKTTFGKILNISSSKNYIGASYLSSISALKVGCGYMTLACPKSIVPIIASMTPDLTFALMEETNEGTIAPTELNLLQYNVISMGCGITTNETTAKFIKNILEQIYDTSTVIDADALNIISKLNLTKLPPNVILTPHPKEMERLLNIDVAEINANREKIAIECAKKFNATVILKGHNTVVTDGTKIYINQTGNSALAKAGSGDVLTGIISGLLAQGLNTFEAAVKGVYLHGLTGEIAAKELSEYSVLASDLINYLPQAIMQKYQA